MVGTCKSYTCPGGASRQNEWTAVCSVEFENARLRTGFQEMLKIFSCTQEGRSCHLNYFGILADVLFPAYMAWAAVWRPGVCSPHVREAVTWQSRCKWGRVGLAVVCYCWGSLELVVEVSCGCCFKLADQYSMWASLLRTPLLLAFRWMLGIL